MHFWHEYYVNYWTVHISADARNEACSLSAPSFKVERKEGGFHQGLSYLSPLFWKVFAYLKGNGLFNFFPFS